MLLFWIIRGITDGLFSNFNRNYRTIFVLIGGCARMISGRINFGTESTEINASDEHDAADSRLARIIN